MILGVIDGIFRMIFSFYFIFLYILYAYTLYIIMLYSEHIVIWTINLVVKMYYTMGLKETKNCLNHRLIVWHIYTAYTSCSRAHTQHTHTYTHAYYNVQYNMWLQNYLCQARDSEIIIPIYKSTWATDRDTPDIKKKTKSLYSLRNRYKNFNRTLLKVIYHYYYVLYACFSCETTLCKTAR